MTYRPLPATLTIGKSSIDGLGLFAVSAIPSGTILGITHIRHVPSGFEAHPDFIYGLTRTPLGGFFNHSNTPNCEIVDHVDRLELRAVCDILPGDELVAHYTHYIPES